MTQAPPRLLDDLAEAMALLSRLPVPAHCPRGAGSAWAWPLAGAVLGGLAAAAGALALGLGLAPGVAAAVVLGAGALLTGGLHEDGLADTADGLYGGRDRAQRLAIMKDSRVGSYGVLALVVVGLARWAALAALAGAGGWALVCGAAAAGALSRAAMAAVMAALPNARGSGLSAATGRPSGATAGLAALIALAVALLLAGWAGLAMALAAGVAAAAVALVARARIGGQTGDILGAAQQLAEAAALAAR